MIDYGPTACSSTERSCIITMLLFILIYYRYEAFNSIFRAQNVHGNRQAPSKDIAHSFATIECRRCIAAGGYCDGAQ